MVPISYLALEFLGVLNVDKEPAICVDGMVARALPVALVVQGIKPDRKKSVYSRSKVFLHLNQILFGRDISRKT